MAGPAYRSVSGIVFAVVALAHLVRAIQAIPVSVGSTEFPVWLSWAAVVVAGSLSVWAFRGR
jgi:multidrug transporter EmrE-like cation transporter